MTAKPPHSLLWPWPLAELLKQRCLQGQVWPHQQQLRVRMLLQRWQLKQQEPGIQQPCLSLRCQAESVLLN